MKNKTYTLSTVLTAVLAAVLAAMVLIRTLAPQIILPIFDIPTLTAISLVALVLDHYLAHGAKRCYICIPVFSTITFGVLPFAACFVGAGEALMLAVLGAVVFTAITLIPQSSCLQEFF